jgi:hypothetical protein
VHAITRRPLIDVQLCQQLASARARFVITDSSQFRSWKIECCLDVAKAACAIFIVGCQCLTGRRALALETWYYDFPRACPVFAAERVMTCDEIQQSWLWYAFTVLVQCGVADTRQELATHYRLARLQNKTPPMCLALDLTPEQIVAVCDAAALDQALCGVEKARRAGQLRGGLTDDNDDDFRRDVGNACHFARDVLHNITLVSPQALHQRLPLRALADELTALLRLRKRFALEACISRLLTNDLFRGHLRQATHMPECIMLAREDVTRILDEDFCMRAGSDAAADDADVLVLASALFFGLYRFSREEALRWLRFLALRCTTPHGLQGVCYVLLQLSDAGAVVTRGSAHLDVSAADYGFDTETWEPHGHALAVWLGAWHGYVVAQPATERAESAERAITTQVSGADTLYFIPGAAAAVRVSTAVAAPCDVVAEFFVEPPRGPPLQPLRTRMADKVL